MTLPEIHTITPETKEEGLENAPAQVENENTQEQSNNQGYWKLPKQMSDEYYEQHKEEYTFKPALENKQYYEKHKNSKPKNKLYEINIDNKISTNIEKEATVKEQQALNKLKQEITSANNKKRQLEKLQKMEKNKRRRMGIPEPKPKMSTKAYYEKYKNSRNPLYERDMQRIRARMSERQQAMQELEGRYNRPRRDIESAYARKDSRISSASTDIGIN